MGLWPTTVTKSCTQELLADVRPKVLQDIGKLVSWVSPPPNGWRFPVMGCSIGEG